MGERGIFYILYYISFHVTLVQLLDIIGDVNHAVIIGRFWLYYSNNEKALPLVKYSLDLVCYSADVDYICD